MYKTLRNFTDSLEKKFTLGAKKQEKILVEDVEMENDDRMEIDAERMNQTYTSGHGKINPNKVEVFSIK